MSDTQGKLLGASHIQSLQEILNHFCIVWQGNHQELPFPLFLQVKSRAIPGDNMVLNLKRELLLLDPGYGATPQELSSFTLAMVSALSAVEKVAKNVSIY